MNCIWCKKEIIEGTFPDKKSFDEWTISGLCPDCQKEVWEMHEEMTEEEK